MKIQVAFQQVCKCTAEHLGEHPGDTGATQQQSGTDGAIPREQPVWGTGVNWSDWGQTGELWEQSAVKSTSVERDTWYKEHVYEPRPGKTPLITPR
ncbi:hypothetical protein AV530_005185 [Patagioenas fasciata monilis]|uniref:Uncharacterized protein n=1 Tax=Patagioenas fasciata monilis TaxID=372326 RepID=A0A1V4K4B6_PATFA|nr:hypothetical protein AV530_005185 [Patagioenas fasciata monilis]